MLSVKSYVKSLGYIAEIVEYAICLRNNLDMLSREDAKFSRMTLGDMQDAGDHITATIAKISNLCASEIGDSVNGSSK